MRGEEVVRIVPGKQERLLLKLLSVCGLTKAFLWPLVPKARKTQRGTLRCAFEVRRLCVLFGLWKSVSLLCSMKFPFLQV